MNDIKKRRELTVEDRYVVERCCRRGYSSASLAELLCVSIRTIRRELQRGMVEQLDSQLRPYRKYSAYYAQERHLESVGRRGRRASYAHHADFLNHVRTKLRDKWSPDAITGSLRLEGERTVCTKTLYNWLHRGYVKDFKLSAVRRKVKARKVCYRNSTAKRIDKRPVEANERHSGHWEMDLVVSGQGQRGSLLVLTERASRYELIYHLRDKKQSSVLEVFNRLERRHKGKFREMFRTITCDNGSEFLDNAGLECSLLDGSKRTEIYYAHPYSSWERGSNENANKLIRKFIKKGDDISKLPVAYIKRIEKWMNAYPRRIFGYKTANDIRIT